MSDKFEESEEFTTEHVICTHCKLAEVEADCYKYCLPCYKKLEAWLEEQASSEPEDLVHPRRRKE